MYKLFKRLFGWRSLSDSLPNPEQEVWIDLGMGRFDKCIFTTPPPAFYVNGGRGDATYLFVPCDSYSEWVNRGANVGVPATPAYVRFWRAVR